MSVAAVAAAAPKPSVRANIAAPRLKLIGRAIVLVPPSVLAIFMLQISYSCGKSSSVLDGRRAARQGVPQVEPDRVLMGVLRRVRSHKPRVAEEVSILQHKGKGAVLGVLPKRLGEAERKLLGAAILTVGRAGKAVTDQRTVQVASCVPLDVDAAVISVERRVFDGCFEAGNGGTGVHQGGAAVSADDEIGGHAEQVAATAIAPEVVGDQAEILDHFHVR